LKHFFLGLLPDGAGVEQENIGMGGLMDFLLLLGQDRPNNLGVVNIHLATIGLDVEGGSWFVDVLVSLRSLPSLSLADELA